MLSYNHRHTFLDMCALKKHSVLQTNRHDDQIASSRPACGLKGTSPTLVVLGTVIFKSSRVSLLDPVQQPITAGVWGNSPFEAISGHVARVWKLS
jgi:hypothetical protein